MSFKMNLVRKVLCFEKEKLINNLKNAKSNNIYELLSITDQYRTPPQKLKRFVMRDIFSEDIKTKDYTFLKLTPNFNKKYYKNTIPQDNLCVFYIHGGGFCTGFPEQGIYLLKRLIKEFGCDCICARYPLSPENIYPSAINTIEKIYNKISLNYNKIIIVGESAGANLSVSLMLKLREKRKNFPVCLILLSGFFDLTRKIYIHKSNENKDPSLFDQQLKYMAQAYLHGDKIPQRTNISRLKSPAVSPVFARLNNFPPCFFSVCKDEILYDDTIKMVENCKRDKVVFQLHQAKECFHAYAILGDFFPESSRTTKKIIKFILDNTTIKSSLINVKTAKV